MNCPRCGAKVPDDSIFCLKCGTELERQPQVSQEQPPVSGQNEMKLKSGLGRQQTGADVPAQTQQYDSGRQIITQPETPAPKKKSLLWLCIPAGILTLAAIGVGLFFILRFVNKPASDRSSGTEAAAPVAEQKEDLTLSPSPTTKPAKNSDPEYKYDANGNIIKETVYSSNGKVQYWIQYEYDRNGNKIKETRYRSNGSIRYEIKYDSNGHMTKQTTYNADGNKETEEYDQNGNRIKLTKDDDSGNKEIYEYDANGNTIRVTYTNDDGVYYWKESEYNSHGILTRAVEFDNRGYDFSWSEAEYDAIGRIIKCTHYNPDGSIDCWYKDEYDAYGNNIKTVFYNADGSIQEWIEYEYDQFGNMISGIQYAADGSIIYQW